MNKTIRIATRGSELALWQANAVKTALQANGSACEITIIKSSGDVNLTQPIYGMGITGVFTKELDIALLNEEADIAVHSLKDVPTQLAEGLHLAATLQRGAHQDVALLKNKAIMEDGGIIASVATSSLRRKAQWLAKFPHHKTPDIRGNVQTRLRKFHESQEMDGIIFAKAGLERLGILPDDAVVLNWMLPAPAQGIIGIVCRSNDKQSLKVCSNINHQPTFQVATAERQFMQSLQAGCSVPVSALAILKNDEVLFRGAIHDFDGAKSFEVGLNIPISNWHTAGKTCAETLLQQPGAQQLLRDIRDKSRYDETDTQH